MHLSVDEIYCTVCPSPKVIPLLNRPWFIRVSHVRRQIGQIVLDLRLDLSITQILPHVGEVNESHNART